MKQVAVILLPFMMLLSCTSLPSKQAPGQQVPGPRLAYVSMDILFQAARGKWKDVARFEKQLDGMGEQEQRLRELMKKEPENRIHGTDLKRLADNRKILVAQMKKLKGEMLSDIKISIERVAQKEKYDFVLTQGEGMVYGKKSSDITRQVVMELVSRGKRSEPISR